MFTFPTAYWKAGAAFTPNSISNGFLWLDPTDNATITQSGGTASQWNDKSGVGNNVVQATAGKQFAVTASGINSKQVMTCASTKYMNGTMAGGALSAWTIMMVCKPTTLSQFDALIAGTTGAGNLTLEAGSAPTNLDNWIFGVGAICATGVGSFSTGTVYCVTWTYGSGTISIAFNNGTATTAASASRTLPALLNVCGDPTANFTSFRGLLGDVCGYTRVLSGTEQTNLYTNYLKPKWSLP